MSRRVFVHDGDERTDITEGVQILYDHLLASMDWGSGFLSDQEAHRVLDVAIAAGFLLPEDAKEKFEEYLEGKRVKCRTCLQWAEFSFSEETWTHVEERAEYVYFHSRNQSLWVTKFDPVASDHEPVLW